MGQSLVGCKIRGQALTLSLCLPGGLGRAGDHGDVSCPKAHTRTSHSNTELQATRGLARSSGEPAPSEIYEICRARTFLLASAHIGSLVISASGPFPSLYKHRAAASTVINTYRVITACPALPQ